MVNEELRGIFPALMTAFDRDEKLDYNAIGTLTEKLIEAGVDGLYVGGSSAEMILCNTSERMKLLETALDSSFGKPIIAHIGSMSTADSIVLAHHAKTAGATAVSSVTPLYFKYSFREIKHYYERIAEAAELPMVIYNVPALTGTALNFEQLCELLSLDGVGGMKFTSSDFFLLNRLKTAFPDKVFYNGSDEMLLSGLTAGADGGIGTTYNFMPEIFVKIYDYFRDGKYREAHETQTLANRVIAEVLKFGVIPASKVMIKFGGIDYGICREPFLPLDADSENLLYENAYKPLTNFIN